MLAYATLLAWLVIPSAFAGLTVQAYETRQDHRAVIARSRAARNARTRGGK